jgi:hypothetical protein
MENKIQRFDTLRAEEARIRKEMETLKAEIHAHLDAMRVTRWECGEGDRQWIVEKQLQTRRMISVKDVPANIADTYAKTVEYEILKIKKAVTKNEEIRKRSSTRLKEKRNGIEKKDVDG